MNVSLSIPQSPVVAESHVARTHNATVARIFEAKERHDKRYDAMLAKSIAADPNFNFDTGLLLA